MERRPGTANPRGTPGGLEFQGGFGASPYPLKVPRVGEGEAQRAATLRVDPEK